MTASGLYFLKIRIPQIEHKCFFPRFIHTLPTFPDLFPVPVCGWRVYGRAIVAERWCIHPSILVQLRRGGRVVCRQAIDPAGGKGAANTIT
ncbi:MAG: hypothetical protein H6616_17915 [Ignavibacteria bacterium]|nr:hypothetical protein [Ignavibacteria bacterium]